jgi:hypothetical protein
MKRTRSAKQSPSSTRRRRGWSTRGTNNNKRVKLNDEAPTSVNQQENNKQKNIQTISDYLIANYYSKPLPQHIEHVSPQYEGNSIGDSLHDDVDKFNKGRADDKSMC